MCKIAIKDSDGAEKEGALKDETINYQNAVSFMTVKTREVEMGGGGDEKKKVILLENEAESGREIDADALTGTGKACAKRITKRKDMKHIVTARL
jgi:hypothetical protein